MTKFVFFSFDTTRRQAILSRKMITTLKSIYIFASTYLAAFKVLCGLWEHAAGVSRRINENWKRETWRFYERFFPIIFRLFSKATAYFQILPDIMSLNSSDLWKRSFDKSNENLYLLWSWAFHNLQSHYTTSFMTSKYSFETVFELLKFSNNVQY